ncbi:hypothetical protein KSP40_PGU004010 [Platanthera guangdongensis]|uniref:Uncharacterized protein n=1 Tax=Platanthera guangdongensis TaxID=2320717 RepID=A0ABR2MAN1_9ASPA
MGTEILQPQDCIARHGPSVFPRRRFIPVPNPNSAHKLCRKMTSPEAKRRRAGSPKRAKLQQKQLVMGQVTILKRGVPIEAKKEDLGGDLFGPGPMGPDPAMIPKQIRVGSFRFEAVVDDNDGYAGSAFSMSPSPRSLPLPSFSKGHCRSAAPAFEKSATVVLRQLLRLE